MDKTPQQIELDKLHKRIVKRFHKACAEYALIEEGDHVLIGLSGGKDSLALVELLGTRAQVYVPRFRVSAVHVRVRERAYESDASYLEQYCAQYHVPLHIIDTEIGEEQGTKSKEPCFLCAWYRRKAMFNLAQDLGCNKIALGHHKDDIVETLLMNMVFQGAIATIAPKLRMDKMPLELVRPLCLVEEADIARYAELMCYRKQPHLCPFEHVSSRAKVKGLLRQLKSLNPEALDTIWSAMHNIKPDYLPHL